MTGAVTHSVTCDAVNRRTHFHTGETQTTVGQAQVTLSVTAPDTILICWC